jgi:hypothetical protein
MVKCGVDGIRGVVRKIVRVWGKLCVCNKVLCGEIKDWNVKGRIYCGSDVVFNE